MTHADAKYVAAEAIPIVDITPLRDGSDPKAVAQALHLASQNLGFIYIKGHGIPETAITAARSAAMDFFQATEDQKTTVKVSDQHRGWLGMGGAKMQADMKPDLKESFLWGYEESEGSKSDGHPLRGSNQWPDFVPQMQSQAMDYFQYAHSVAEHLMRGFALGLDLPENFFLKACDKPLSRASMVYYPDQVADSRKGQFGVGPHTDFGVLTVLCQDDVGGLQVQDINGDWMHAPPIEGTLIVNVADLLARWTNNAYKSTPHRVVNSSGKERLSLVLAFDPNPETMIDARDVFGPAFDATDDPITCGDYLIWRFEKAFSYRKAQ